jgi:hypothetical protein
MGVSATAGTTVRAATRATPYAAERGAWFLVGIPWLAAMVVGGAPVSGWFLVPPLVFGVLAREPLMWTLWACRRRLPVPPAWRLGIVFAMMAVASTVLWARSAVGWPAFACLAASVGLTAVDVGARVVWSKPTAVGGLAGAVAGGCIATTVMLAAGRPAPLAWVLGACLAYGLGISSCALHLSMQRVPRRASTTSAAVLLWWWTVVAGSALILMGLHTTGERAAVAAVCLGMVRAELARRQPRTTAFRRLGWREGVWLVAMSALVVTLAP